MQIVIDIPEHYYENNIKKELPICLTEEQVVGILPKNHGRLIDANNITFSEFFDAGDYTQAMRGIYNAPTIIDADISEKEIKR